MHAYGYAPGRANLIGEHTDYNGGFVLPFAIERGIFVAARTRTDNQVRLWSSEQENERTLMAVDALRRGAWSELGQLMYGSHDSLRDDFKVSCPELDIVVDEARALEEKGVFGCRMTGGGFGGCCMALVDSGHATEIGEAISAGYRKATGIQPLIFATRPGDGPIVILKP
jgi:galactokinase